MVNFVLTIVIFGKSRIHSELLWVLVPIAILTQFPVRVRDKQTAILNQLPVGQITPIAILTQFPVRVRVGQTPSPSA